MYEARKICNFIIARYGTQSSNLSNARLNKLLYFIHGWSLTSRPHGLVRNHFVAWQLGPVVRPVYDAFKQFGERRVTDLAKYLDYASGETRIIGYEDIADADAETIMRVVESYARYTTGQLIQLSHERGGPWHAVYSAWLKDQRLSPRIPNELIRAHFLKEAGGKIRH